MALNAASHNPSTCQNSLPFIPANQTKPAGERTGPITGQPPQVMSEVTAALIGAQKKDPLGQHIGGQDGGDEDGEKKIKSEKECTDPT